MLHRRKSRLTALAQQAIDLILPPRCPMTGALVDAQGLIAPGFWSQLRFIEAPFCHRCGMPFDFAPESSNVVFLCGACLDYPSVFDKARSATVYDDVSRRMVLKFKYGDELHLRKTFALWLKKAGTELLTETDVIAPVPLHRFKLWMRRFNQAAILASSLGEEAGLPCIPDLLQRTRATKPHKGMTVPERKNNVRGAFDINPSHAARIKDKNVLIIDDVHTTGSTLNECARTLLDAGAAKVFALSLARVVK